MLASLPALAPQLALAGERILSLLANARPAHGRRSDSL
jgi:hypothetical protein